MKISNPILRGFNPDPSICRVGDDYYVATSTFEWYPGVQIHHSRDLKHWQLVARPLNRESLLDMRGSPDSCGVYAPCLSWHDGLFWLLYTDVKRFDGNYKDCPNYLTTCDTIDGEWSDRVFLNSGGFDPSLFHDDDGRKWYTNMVWDHRPDRSFFRGIAMQEYDHAEQKLLGQREFVFDGTELDCTEGPHHYRYGDYYYLITAEGGTSYGHAVTMARARDIHGPYEVDPAGPVFTSRDNPDWPLQRAGHADLVQTPAGDFYMLHLCSRPLPGTRRSPLGRESAIQRVVLTDEGWFRPANGSALPALEISIDNMIEVPVDAPIQCDNFNTAELNAVYQWLRTPFASEWYSLSERPGYLRLAGRDSIGGLFEQALIARRQTDFSFRAETKVDFEPQHFQQQAGLTYYYNSHKFYYIYISTDDEIGKHICVMFSDDAPALTATFHDYESRIAIPNGVPVYLAADVNVEKLRLSWSLDGTNWNTIEQDFDASLISSALSGSNG